MSKEKGEYDLWVQKEERRIRVRNFGVTLVALALGAAVVTELVPWVAGGYAGLLEESRNAAKAKMIPEEGYTEINGFRVFQYTPTEIMIRPQSDSSGTNLIDYDRNDTRDLINRVERFCGRKNPLPPTISLVRLFITTKQPDCQKLLQADAMNRVPHE